MKLIPNIVSPDASKTATGRDRDEVAKEMLEKTKNTKPVHSWEEFLTAYRKLLEDKQKNTENQ